MLTTLLFALNLSTNEAQGCAMADAAAAAEAKTKVEASEGSKAEFKVDGMTCGGCTEKVVAALQGVDGVFAAAVDYQAGTASVAYDPAKVDEAKLLEAINGTGFAASNS
jgi:copper chaperone